MPELNPKRMKEKEKRKKNEKKGNNGNIEIENIKN